MILNAYSSHLAYEKTKNGEQLFFDGVDIDALARRYGTPLFAYSANHVRDQGSWFKRGLANRDYKIHYAVKANANLSLLSLCREQGIGFDVVSAGELQRLLHINVPGEAVVFSGVGKSTDELLFALRHSVSCINIESFSEARRISEIAQREKIIAAVSVRINPNINSKTHPYISTGLLESKFGVSIKEAIELYRWLNCQPYLSVRGVTCHIGSQLLDFAPIYEAAHEVVAMVDELKRHQIDVKRVNLGGGIGVTYSSNQGLTDDSLHHYFSTIKDIIPHDLAIDLEPGRFLLGNAGILLTKVEYLKKQGDKIFVVVDAAMNDLLRPALYQAHHEVVSTITKPGEKQLVDVVGPVCETADFLAKERKLSVKEGDYLAFLSCGAYCACMSSNYNSRARAAEVLLDGGESKLIRKRESFERMIADEIVV